ncbi:cupin domain-containing protein (plasmid) [Spirosoma sp. SC4-14]|uniref:cupin domain-containing protein n=1 Tax=Spirosoma sp. SC4-14 TaxID=3128900 RepID=UPI0030D55799
MAYRNKIIRNAKTGQEIMFLHTAQNTDGQFLGMYATFQPQPKPTVLYCLPQQTVDFDVLSGELTILLKGKYKHLISGQAITIAANQPHALWNGSTQQTTINCRVRPALNTEYLLETVIGIASAEADNRKGISRMLQIALTANSFSNVFRLSNFPFIFQKVVFFFLTPIAYLAGLKPVYKEYID